MGNASRRSSATDWRPSPPGTHGNAIRLLTEIRLRGYQVHRTLSDVDKAGIRELVEEIGCKIIRVDLAAAGKLNAFPRAQARFYEALDAVHGGCRDAEFIVYAAQLLQYYTVSCDVDTMAPGKSLGEFHSGLSAKAKAFGDTSTNPFLVDHRLVLLYNDIARLEDALVTEDAGKMQDFLETATSQLNAIDPVVSTMVDQSSSSTFVHYLSFVLHYARAKLTEVAARVYMEGTGAGEADGTIDQLIDRQQVLLRKAMNDLERIKRIKVAAAELRRAEIGNEYALGQGIFRKLPVGDFDTIVAHVGSLIS